MESNLLRRQETDSRKKFPGQLWVRGFTGALGWRCEKQRGDRVAAAATEVGRHRHRVHQIVLLELGGPSWLGGLGTTHSEDVLATSNKLADPRPAGQLGEGGECDLWSGGLGRRRRRQRDTHGRR